MFGRKSYPLKISKIINKRYVNLINWVVGNVLMDWFKNDGKGLFIF